MKEPNQLGFRRSEMDALVMAVLDNQMRAILHANSTPIENETPQQKQAREETIQAALLVMERIKATAENEGVIEDLIDPLDEVIDTTRSTKTQKDTTAEEILEELAASAGAEKGAEEETAVMAGDVLTLLNGDMWRVGEELWVATVTGAVRCYAVTDIRDEKLYGVELNPVTGKVESYDTVLLPFPCFKTEEQARARAQADAEWRASVIRPGEPGFSS